MHGMRNLLIGIVLLGLAAAGGIHWMQIPRPDASFVVLLQPMELAFEPGPPLEPGLGVRVTQLATNAEVEAEDTAPIAGRYAVSTWSSDEDGRIHMRRIRFDPGPYQAVDQDVLERVILDGFGRLALRYALRIEGALSDDGTQYAFYLLPTANGRGDPTTVACGVDYEHSGRILTLTIDEYVAGETRRFRVAFDVGSDGALSRRP